MVDVRDVANAHVRLLEAEAGAGRHVLGGKFLRWGEIIDLFEAITGRTFHRLPIPGAILRAAGHAGDALKRVWDFELPLTHEATRIMTRWAPVVPAIDLGITYRDPRETLADWLTWMHAAGHVPAKRLGQLRYRSSE